jgi:hypothetical protein
MALNSVKINNGLFDLSESMAFSQGVYAFQFVGDSSGLCVQYQSNY